MVLRKVTAREKGQDETTERKEDEESQANVWVMRQMTVRMRDQVGLSEREENERSEGSVG